MNLDARNTCVSKKTKPEPKPEPCAPGTNRSTPMGSCVPTKITKKNHDQLTTPPDVYHKIPTTVPSAGAGPRRGALLIDLPVTSSRWTSVNKSLIKNVPTASNCPNVGTDLVYVQTYPKGSGANTSYQGPPKIEYKSSSLPNALVFVMEAYWPTDFDFTNKGKLSGIFVGTGVSSGCSHSATGSSHRIMWYQQKKAPTSGIISYMYPPVGPKQFNPDFLTTPVKGHARCGNGIWNMDPGMQTVLTKGVWHTLEVGIQLNTFTNGKPNQDGIGYIAIDGKSREVTKIIWAATPAMKITGVNLGSFFGGSAISSKNQSAYFKKFGVYAWNAAGASDVVTDTPHVYL